MNIHNSTVLLLGLLALTSKGFAAGARPSSPSSAKVTLGAADRAELETGLAVLEREMDRLRTELRQKPALALLPDVEIFHKAVDWPLRYGEFYRSNEVALARTLLKQGLERAQALRGGQAPWLAATGLVVRGYRSAIDGSVQPYGLVVPASFRVSQGADYRLDIWLHGRDNNLTELKFMADRQKSLGEFAPTNAIVLHPYGRYCNAFKFAGEMDVLEAMEQVLRDYQLNRRRIAVRGFSMGGAGCWHLAAHHPELWRAAAPGAGFAETAEYTGALKGDLAPAWYEQKLWHLYDATDYAANLHNFPVIAYSGELDKQKQAADIMARAMKVEGLSLDHLIGPGVEHKYEPKTRQELARRFDVLMESQRELRPKKIIFTTWTLRYNQAGWLRVEGLEKHWNRARVSAEIDDERILTATTTNVSAVSFDMSGTPLAPKAVILDGQKLTVPPSSASGTQAVHFIRVGQQWRVGAGDADRRRKRPGLQGPIDDAFMGSFLMVRPTGEALHEKPGAWVGEELRHATNEWRAQFRGDARVKNDREVSDQDIRENNLILWGDPLSNKLLARLTNGLPLKWDDREVRVGANSFSASQHVPVLIFPNPLNPERYVVLNSGFTFSGFRAASNAQQTPKLPDYAVFDVEVPRGSRLASGVVLAGFFDEEWAVKPER